MEILYAIIGLFAGLLIGYLIIKSKYSSDVIRLSEKNDLVVKENIRIKEDIDKDREIANNFMTENAKLKADYKNIELKLAEQKKEIEDVQKKFSLEFENLANKIFEEKSQKFTEQNKSNIDEVLKPLGEKIKDFEKRVNEVYVTDSKERASLSEQLKNLQSLNKQMSEDANNLTKALKGDSQKRGAWGEFILEKILERSGLQKDREYSIQSTMFSDEGRRQRPDVLINLPEDKHLIIDSKVSLKAYDLFCSAEDENSRQQFLNEHINSMRTHIKLLNLKAYQSLYNINSLDFVLMFVPIEPAFALAMQNNPGLFDEAFEKNIVIVSPSTLLATLRTVANIWKQEKQNINALEIAKQSGALYDKFVSFIEDLKRVGEQMDISKRSYLEAMKKLYEGSGNLVSRSQKIKELGAKTNKYLPQNLVDRATEGNKSLFEETE